MFIPPLKHNQVIDSDKLIKTFICDNSNGIRPSSATNTIVIISKHIDKLYDDRWDDDVLHYTGMGQKGDQSLTHRNKSLLEAEVNNYTIYLFEVFNPNEYTFRGEVKLAGEPYQEQQLDIEGMDRTVWMFPLKLVDGSFINEAVVESNEQYRKRALKRKPIQELREKAFATESAKPSKRTVVTTRFISSPYITEYAKRRANGKCELCEQNAPFVDTDGLPYLEGYRIEPLSMGGSDAVDNVAALCPNCRTKMQILNLPEDREKLLKLAFDDTVRIETDLTEEEKAIVKSGRNEYQQHPERFVALDSLVEIDKTSTKKPPK